MDFPEDLRYLDTHEYVKLENDIATVGITDFAVHELGDIVFVELPEVGTEVEQESTCGTIESVKAVADLNSPVTGTVVEVNTALEDSPETVTEDPYQNGWLFKVRVTGDPDLTHTLTAEQYSSLITAD